MFEDQVMSECMEIPDQTYSQHYMRRLPPELMGEIFTRCLPAVPSLKSSEAPLLLTNVCSSWRECAISHPSLWDTIYLPPPITGISAGTLELCALWLKRSKNRLLTVDLYLASDYHPWKISDEHLNRVDEVVQLLRPHSYRLRKLLRVLPRFLLEDLRLEDMPNLDELFLCDVPDDGSGRPRDVPRGLIAPRKLQTLSLRQTFFDLKCFSSLPQLVNLDLWQLQGEGQMSIHACLELLRQLPCLESCTLDVAPGDFSENPSQEIVMPYMTFFFVSWDWMVDVGPIFDVIRTPALRRLGLRGPPPTRGQWDHLKLFLARCKPLLTQLSIKEIGFTDMRLLECLKLCPTLTNLSLSHCSVDSDFLKALSLDHHAPPNTCILPQLEFLSLEACDEFDVKDLIQMLNTRGKCIPLYGRRRLRGIRLSFCKRILEKHQEQLEHCGVESVTIRPLRTSYTNRSR